MLFPCIHDVSAFTIGHDVSAFTIGNTITETWRGVPVIRSYRSMEKSNFYVFFVEILLHLISAAFQCNYGSVTMRDIDYFCYVLYEPM